MNEDKYTGVNIHPASIVYGVHNLAGKCVARAIIEITATTARALETEARARFFREGEAEEREVKLSEPALARWRDDVREVLVCPRCEIEERMKGG